MDFRYSAGCVIESAVQASIVLHFGSLGFGIIGHQLDSIGLVGRLLEWANVLACLEVLDDGGAQSGGEMHLDWVSLLARTEILHDGGTAVRREAFTIGLCHLAVD